MERILFYDADYAVISAINDHLDELGFTGVRAYPAVPANRPARFVTVERTGGPRRNLVVDGAQITIDAWGRDRAEAHDLAQAARAIVNALEGTTTVDELTVYGVDEFSGPAFLPDPDTDQPRFRWTTSVNTRGAAA